jgi:hypothetical protein
MRTTVEQWWQHVFDVDDALWSSTTVLHRTDFSVTTKQLAIRSGS